jgi:capsular polysaccharide transport system permease protein
VKSTYEHGTHVVALVLTGYMPITLWRHTTNNAMFLLRRSASVLYHRKLTLFDAFAARMALEVIGTTAALLMVYGTLLFADILQPIVDLGLFVLAWIILAFLGSGLALVFAAISEYSESSEKFLAPFQYLMVPLSGVFFLVDWLPQTGQDLILYNPLTNCIEMFRAGLFGEHVATYYSIWYPIACTAFLWVVGLILLEVARQRFSTS